MERSLWWRNFSTNSEMHIAGAFLYDGIHALHVAESLDDPTTSFQLLYDLSIGIERLQKVALLLHEHDGSTSAKEFEDGLVGHNTAALANRLEQHAPQNLASIHKEFLHLLTNFYKNARYGRFSNTGSHEMHPEHELLVRFICKHLGLGVPDRSTGFAFSNTNQIRKFIGTVLRRIVEPILEAIRTRSSDLGIFSYEIRPSSKAGRLFYTLKFDLIEDEVALRELLLFLMNDTTKSNHRDLIQSIVPLDLDPGMAPAFAAALLSHTPESLAHAIDDIDSYYEEVDDIKERLQMLELLDSDSFWFEEE